MKNGHSGVDGLLFSFVMFGCLCILDSDLGWAASMAMIFRVDGDDLLGERLCELVTCNQRLWIT